MNEMTVKTSADPYICHVLLSA